MKQIEIKKIHNKIEIDTTAQGCWSDCATGEYTYSGITQECYDAGIGECEKKEKMSAKTCWIW